MSPPVEAENSMWCCHQVGQSPYPKRRERVECLKFPNLNRARDPVRLTIINRNKYVKDKTTKKTVDSRKLKNGQIRLRFKVSEWALNLISKALAGTAYEHKNAALDAISLNCMTSYPFETTKIDQCATGKNRFLVNLYPDQYDIVRAALNLARQHVATDADALVLICLWLVESESIVSSKSIGSVKKTHSFLQPMASRALVAGKKCSQPY